jgi:hypothetical protein
MKLKTFKYSIESLEQQYDKAIEEINKTLVKVFYINVVDVEFLNSEIAVIKYKIKCYKDGFEDEV